MSLIDFLCRKENCLLYKLESKFRQNSEWKQNLELALKNSIKAGRVKLITTHILPKQNNFEIQPVGFTILTAKNLTAYFIGTRSISIIDHYKRRHNIDLDRSKFLPCISVMRTGTQPQFFPLETLQICFQELSDYKQWSIDYWLNPTLPGVWNPRATVSPSAPGEPIIKEGTECSISGRTILPIQKGDILIYLKAEGVKSFKLKF